MFALRETIERIVCVGPCGPETRETNQTCLVVNRRFTMHSRIDRSSARRFLFDNAGRDEIAASAFTSSAGGEPGAGRVSVMDRATHDTCRCS